MPVFAKDFPAGVPSPDQLINEILGVLASGAVGGAQELPAYEVAAVKGDEPEEPRFRLAVAESLNCLDLGVGSHRNSQRRH